MRCEREHKEDEAESPQLEQHDPVGCHGAECQAAWRMVSVSGVAGRTISLTIYRRNASKITVLTSLISYSTFPLSFLLGKLTRNHLLIACLTKFTDTWLAKVGRLGLNFKISV